MNFNQKCSKISYINCISLTIDTCGFQKVYRKCKLIQNSRHKHTFIEKCVVSTLSSYLRRVIAVVILLHKMHQYKRLQHLRLSGLPKVISHGFRTYSKCKNPHWNNISSWHRLVANMADSSQPKNVSLSSATSLDDFSPSVILHAQSHRVMPLRTRSQRCVCSFCFHVGMEGGLPSLWNFQIRMYAMN